MRKLTVLLLLPLLAVLHAQAEPLQVFACEPEWGALTREIAGARADITVAIHPSQDPHKIEARPTLISAVRRADLVFCTGADLEVGWLPVLLARGANPQVRQPPGLLYAAEQVTLIDIPARLDRADGDLHAAGNPHMHLDPQRLLVVADALSARLAALDPDHRAQYENALADFRQRMTTAMARWQQQAAPLRGENLIVHHRSFSYLLNWLGINTVAELEPKPGLPPTAAHLAELVSVASDNQVQLILYADYNGDRGARWLAERSEGCAVRLPLSPADTLFALFDEQISALLRASQECQ